MKSPTRALTARFIADLTAACDAAVEARKRELVAVALGRLGKRGPGRPREVR
jgi:hypothetical protein